MSHAPGKSVLIRGAREFDDGLETAGGNRKPGHLTQGTYVSIRVIH